MAPLAPSTQRTVIAAVIIALAVHFTQSRDLLVDYTRPVVMTSLRWLGIEAVDRGDVMAVGHLHVPWTRDCAGINLLLILLALAVWVNRQEKHAGRFWFRVVSMIPAALLANVLRVLTLIAYRTLAYPSIESPQTHYFIGFVWLVPFVTFITPKDHRPKSASIMETLHAAAVVSLLAPMAGTPNATLITVAAVICLSFCRMRRTPSAILALWMGGGLSIAVLSLESFWLPWLLLCPAMIDLRQMRWLHRISVPFTHSLIAMQPWAWWLAGAGWMISWFLVGRASASSASPSPSETEALTPGTTLHFAALIPFCAALSLPFLASTVLSLGQEAWVPPPGVEARLMNQQGYEIRLPGQPAHVGLACYVAASRDRHHTVKVCLQYRGVEVVSVEEDERVLTEGRHWFREFFLQDDQLLPDYAAYVKNTFRPWSDPGVHLIFASLCEKQSPAEFSAVCEQLANDFYQQCQLRSAIP